MNTPTVNIDIMDAIERVKCCNMHICPDGYKDNCPFKKRFLKEYINDDMCKDIGVEDWGSIMISEIMGNSHE